MATALYLIPANLLFAAFVGLPFILPLFIGDIMAVSKLGIIKTIFLVFIIPLILGDLTRRVIVRLKSPEFFDRRVKPNLGSAGAVGILILVFLIMSLERNTILLKNLDRMAIMVPPVILFYGFLYLISTAWAWFLMQSGALPGEKAVVIVYTSVARHVNISLALILSSFPVCIFRSISATHSAPFRPPITPDSGHLLRLIPAAYYDPLRPPVTVIPGHPECGVK
jgi:arsenite transporter